MLAREDGYRQPVPKQSKAFPPGPPRPWNNSVFVESSHLKKKAKTTQKTLPQACSNILSVNNLESKVTFPSEHSVGRVGRGQRGMRSRECTTPSPRHSQAGDRGRAGKAGWGEEAEQEGALGVRGKMLSPFFHQLSPKQGQTPPPSSHTSAHPTAGRMACGTEPSGLSLPRCCFLGTVAAPHVGMSGPAHRGASCTTGALLQ